jgi:hypothetical protein
LTPPMRPTNTAAPWKRRSRRDRRSAREAIMPLLLEIVTPPARISDGPAKARPMKPRPKSKISKLWSCILRLSLPPVAIGLDGYDDDHSQNVRGPLVGPWQSARKPPNHKILSNCLRGCFYIQRCAPNQVSVRGSRIFGLEHYRLAGVFAGAIVAMQNSPVIHPSKLSTA